MFFWVLQIVSQILLDYLYFLIRKGLINSHRLIISPDGCFMKRQQLVWLFLSLSGCFAHVIRGINWRNLLFFISLSPVLHLILYCTLSFCCLGFSLIVWVSIETRVVWGCTETGVAWTSTWGIWITVWVLLRPRKPFLGRGVGGSLTFCLLSLEPHVWGQSRRTGGSWRFYTQIYTLRI